MLYVMIIESNYSIREIIEGYEYYTQNLPLHYIQNLHVYHIQNLVIDVMKTLQSK